MSTRHIKELEKKITVAISQIRKGTITPKDSNIGNLFKYLKPYDESLHEKLMAEYKIVFEEWKKRQS